MTGFGVSEPALGRIAKDMRASTASLDAASMVPVSEINAGQSTVVVQVSIAALTRAASGLLAGTKGAADDLEAGRATYTKADDVARENMPRDAGDD